MPTNTTPGRRSRWIRCKKEDITIDVTNFAVAIDDPDDHPDFDESTELEALAS